MNEEQIERLLAALEEIAMHLHSLNNTIDMKDF